MAIQLIEPIIVELVDRLRNDFAAHVTTINAAVTDGFTIEAPGADQVLGYPPAPELLTVFPTLAVSDGRSTFEDDTGYSATGRHLVLICAYAQDADQEALAWRLRRYSQAIVRTVLEGRKLDTAAWGTGLDGVYPGPAYVDNPDPESVQTWMSWVGVRIWAKREEE